MTSTVQELNSQLPGVWSLDSVYLYPSASLNDDPHMRFTTGDNNILGRAVFTSAGYMNGTVAINREDRSTLTSKDWGLLKDGEIIRIARMMSTYSGPWQLYEKEGEVWMKVLVEIALNPSWEGSPQLRRKVEIQEAQEKDGRRELYLTLAPVEAITLPVSPPFPTPFFLFH